MNAPDLEQVVRDSNQRLQRIEQILPTLATKEELQKLATKDELHKLATKQDLHAAAMKEELNKLATKDELQKLATKEELQKLATKDELQKLATREELQAAVAALRGEIREGNENNLRQFQILAEDLRTHMRLMADSFMGKFQIHETEHEGLGRRVANHEDRITRLEATRRRPRQ